MHLLTNRQVTLIVNNITRACRDINRLNKIGYNFLYLCSGFIAHFNIHGFKDYYRDISLLDDIVLNYDANKYLNFTAQDKDYEYYNQKAEIYKQIVNNIK